MKDPKSNEVGEAIRMARAYCAEILPWLAPALYAAKIVVTEDCPVAAVDQQWRVYFNPMRMADIIDANDLGTAICQIAFIWYHEIAHVVREHAIRFDEIASSDDRSYDRNCWAIATDMEINDLDLPQLTPPTLFPPVLPCHGGFDSGKLAEQYQRSLAQLKKTALRKLIKATWHDGSGVHGEPQPWELPADEEGLGPVDQAHLRHTVATNLASNKSIGSDHGNWLRWAEHELNPKVDWRKELKRRIRQTIAKGVSMHADYTFHRPHRRQTVFAPFIRPSLRSEGIAHIACIVDTSGSMTQDDLGQVLAEVKAIFKVIRSRVTIIPCDTRAYEPIMLTRESDCGKLASKLVGGGGTDLTVGIDRALALKADATIVLTDGFTPYPRVRIPTLVFAILPQESIGRYLPPMPPWRESDVVWIR